MASIKAWVYLFLSLAFPRSDHKFHIYFLLPALEKIFCYKLDSLYVEAAQWIISIVYGLLLLHKQHILSARHSFVFYGGNKLNA